MRAHIAGDMLRTLVTLPTLMVFVAPLPRSSNGNGLPQSTASADRFKGVEICRLSEMSLQCKPDGGRGRGGVEGGCGGRIGFTFRY
jgi:hypothetical protein